MAFIGTAVIKQVTDRVVRITGLSLDASQSGTIGLHGGTSLGDTLGAAATFGILAKQYVNGVPGTTIDGNLGFITAPATPPTVTGATHVNDATYASAAGGVAASLALLQALPATFTFAPGNIDLSTDITHGPAGAFEPGVYEIQGNATIDAAGLELEAGGLYVFRISGTLTTAGTSQVLAVPGVDPNDVWWIPTGASSLGATSTFFGNLVPKTQGNITVGAGATWTGRALTAAPAGVGGVVTTDTDTITAPLPAGATVRLPAALFCSVYPYDGHTVELQDSIICTVIGNTPTPGAPLRPISVVKTGTKVSDFLITITNNTAIGEIPAPDNTGNLEIYVKFH